MNKDIFSNFDSSKSVKDNENYSEELKPSKLAIIIGSSFNERSKEQPKKSFLSISSKKIDVPKYSSKNIKFKKKYFRNFIKKLGKSIDNSIKTVFIFFNNITRPISRKFSSERSILIFINEEKDALRLPINNATVLFFLFVLSALTYTGIDAYAQHRNDKVFYDSLSAEDQAIYTLAKDYKDSMSKFATMAKEYDSEIKNLAYSLNYNKIQIDDNFDKNDINSIQESSDNNIKFINGYFNANAKIKQTIPVGWPVTGSSRITSGYGPRLNPFTKKQESFHYGIDIAGSYASPVLAVADGVVSYSGWRGGYGWLVMITHANGYQTLYGHNSKLVVFAGQKVKRGQEIALMGNTGRTTGIHCHFEVRVDSRAVNPSSYIGVRLY